VTATMNIARNTRDIPINGIFANKSTRAMRPTSIDRMTVIPVNTFRHCGMGEMELDAASLGGDLVGEAASRGVRPRSPVFGGGLIFQTRRSPRRRRTPLAAEPISPAITGPEFRPTRRRSSISVA
jgi:hypothetical protein